MKTKICKECLLELPETRFQKCNTYKGHVYRLNVCKTCRNGLSAAYSRTYRKEHPEKSSEWSKRQYSKDKQDPQKMTKIKKAQLNRYPRYARHRMFKNALSRARKHGYEFTIKEEDIIIPKYCPLLGVELVTGTKDDYRYSPSIDRIDNSKGYTPDNTRIISSMANTMKNSATIEELLLFIQNLPKYLGVNITNDTNFFQ